MEQVMTFLRKLISKINSSPILRSICLFICGLIIFGFVMSILLNLFTRHNSHIEVPNFEGLELSEAQKMARKSNLTLEVNDSTYMAGCTPGAILDQIPSAGREVKSGRRVFITINAHTRKMVEIPYVTGFSLRQAKNNLQAAGLEIARLIYQSDIATNYVLQESYKGSQITPGSKKEAEMGSGITLVVGKSGDAGLCKVPKLVSYSLSEAKSRLWEVGLNVGKIEMDDDITEINIKDARVYIQQPEQGSYTGLGTDVSMKLTLDGDAVQKAAKKSDAASKQFKAPPVVVGETEGEETGVENEQIQ